MNRPRRILVLLVSLLLLGACGSEQEASEELPDAGPEAIIVPDFIIQDTGFEIPNFETVEPVDTVTEDLPPQEAVSCSGLKCAYEICSENSECESGLCVEGPDSKYVCSEFCIDTCPTGWGCVLITMPGSGDSVFACIYKGEYLCKKECATDSDCNKTGVDLCMEMGSDPEGIPYNFCLQDCSTKPCPDEEIYECREIEKNDKTYQQCWPKSDSCICDLSIDYQTDPVNCGQCEYSCFFDNAEPLCVGGECAMGACAEGWVDLNEDPSDGCEYECTWTSDLDLPDVNYTDANCDGMDGTIDLGVFVALSGSDEGNTEGTMDEPFRSLSAAIDFSSTHETRKHVYVAQGTYIEQVTMADGVSMFGGYSASNDWARDILTYETVIQWDALFQGMVITLIASGVESETYLDGFKVIAGNNTSPGGSTYAIYSFHAGPNLIISNNQVVAGNGANGLDGEDANDAQPGENGENGNNGCEYDSTGLICFGCADCSQPDAGSGGISPCGNNGGGGGKGGKSDSSGVSGSPGSGGAPGGSGGSATNSGSSGAPGAVGAVGDDGVGGTAGGALTPAGFWSANSGTDGVAGQAGHGGGGGGGGGGDSSDWFHCCQTYGGSGGGGGAGGCGAAAGSAGTGGGGSFGVFLLQSGPTFESNIITYKSGGNGGAGGLGGVGGQGGKGGSGGDHGVDDNEGGGGNGGAGGAGGDGGSGGGGAGGVAYGLYIAGASDPLCLDNTFIQAGVAGYGGQGGDGSILTKGADGTVGHINQITEGCDPQ